MRPVTAVLVRGFGYSGSGLLVDLLSEYSSVATVHGEFDDFRRFGMVGDHLMGRISATFPSQLRTYAADRLAPLARRSQRAIAIGNLKRRIVGLPRMALPERSDILRRRYEMLYDLEASFEWASDRREKLRITVNWLDELTDVYAGGRPFVVFDQPLVREAHDPVWPEVFAPFILIDVFRDPRDQLADTYRCTVGKRGHLLDFALQDRIELEQGRDRLDIMHDIAAGIRRRLTAADERFERFDTASGRRYRISFDRLLEDPEAGVRRIEELIGLAPTDHAHSGTRFLPFQSRRNVGIHREILTSEERDLVSDLVALTRRWTASGPL